MHLNGERSVGGHGGAALIAGVGRFGRNAVHTLAALHPSWRILAVDRKPPPEDLQAGHGMVTFIRGDAVRVMDEALASTGRSLWVIPAVPFHLAFEWLLVRLGGTRGARRAAVPAGLNIPNAMETQTGDVVCSFAQTLCPPECSEPGSICPVTGERRPAPLFQLLGSLHVPGFGVVGLRSFLLSPGVGGYRAVRLRRIHERLLESRGPFLIYTACKCHGVLSAMEIP